MELMQTDIPALSNAGTLPQLPAPVGEPASVLVIDDNPGKLTSLVAVVAAMGLDVATAGSGREALRQLLKRDFAVVLLDVNMPVMDGFETAALIHSRPRSAYTPIIFVTAEAGSDEERIKGYTLGAFDYIYSPIVPEILRAKIRGFVELFYLNRQLRLQAEELREHAEEIARKSLQLEQASRMKSEFLASMSHELRTPLNAIIGFSELLKDGLVGELSTKQTDYVTEIFNSGRHLLSLIDDILDLSKVEAGKMTLDLEPVESSRLLQTCLNVVREKALKHRIKFKLDLAVGTRSIVVDARKVTQIVYNLLANALKFTPDGGVVSISAHAVKRDRLQLEPPEGFAVRQPESPEGDFEEFLEIRVGDNGIGIARDDLPRLFQAFIQIDSTLARQYEGTGLGLALVKRLAKLHGGEVGVMSAPGRGSCFAIWLPWREALAATAEAEAEAETMPVSVPPPADSAAPRQVLVIDDDPRAAEILRANLEQAGFRVVWAADPASALEMAARERPDLITLDLVMPEMGGWEALDRIKADPALATIPVLIVSVVASENKGFVLGATEFLRQPVSRQTLLDAIAELGLGGKSARKLLVADHDPAAIERIAACLADTSYQVLRARSKAALIRTARRSRPDLIMIKLAMLDSGGIDLLETLQSCPETTGIPILVLADRTVTPADRERLKGNVQKIMAKTALEPRHFVAEVERALRRQGGRNAS